MSVTTVAAMPRLALLQTVIDAIAFLRRHRIRVLGVVLVIGLALSLLHPLLDRVPSTDVRLALVCLVHLAVYAGLAYLWCRLVLLSEWAFGRGTGVQVPFTWIQFRGFLCYYALICVGIVTLATALAVALAPALGAMAAGLVSGVLFSLLVVRLSFVLPATALQLPTSFLESWNHTTGHGLRLWAIYACAVLPAVAVIAALAMVHAGLPPTAWTSIAMSFVTWCVGLLGVLAVVTMIAIAYERIVGLPARARRLDRMVGD